MLGVCCFGLFGGSMFCHGELARLKPAADRLTAYYLMIASGGRRRDLVGVVAPLPFRGTLELPLATAACAALLVYAHRNEGRASLALAAVTCLVVLLVTGWHVPLRQRCARDGAQFLWSPAGQGVNPGTEFENRVLVYGTVAHGCNSRSRRAARPRLTTARNAGAALALTSMGDRPVGSAW